MGTPKYGYIGRTYPLEGVGNLPEGRIEELRAVAKARAECCQAAN
jgi:hypothetical protein